MLEGTEGVISLAGDGSVRFRAFGTLETFERLGPSLSAGFGGDCVFHLQQHVVDVVRGKDKAGFENEAQTYLRVVEIEEAIYRSAEAGQWLTL